MSDTDFSTDLTAVLARHGRASHLITVSEEAQIDPRHIKMLCVATGVDAYPLNSACVAVHCPDGVPPALSDLPVTIGEMEAPQAPEPAETLPDDPEAAEPELEEVEEPSAPEASVEADGPPSEVAPAASPAVPQEFIETVLGQLDAIKGALDAGSDAPESGGATEEIERLGSLATKLGEDTGKLDATAARIEGLARRLDAHPVLTVDLIDHRKSVARFTTAASSVLNRIETVADGLEKGASEPGAAPKAGEELGKQDGALARSLLTLCTELLTMGSGGTSASPELKEILASQERLSAQIAELREAAESSQGEALQDLRLAVAEALADGQRQNAIENSA